MWRDLQYAARILGRRPGSALVAVATMALGIAATTVLFSVTWNVLLKPLPWPDQDRLVRVMETRQGSTRRLPAILTNAAYLAWRDHPSTIDAIAAWSAGTATISGGGDPERARVATMTASGFGLVRAEPLLGTVFTEADEPSGNVAVISYGLWQQRYGGQPGVLGRRLEVDGRGLTIVAVMPRGFAFPDPETRAWIPFRVHPVVGDDPNSRYISLFTAMARLRPGVSPAQAAEEATARARTAPDGGMTAIAVFGSRGAPEVTAVPVLDAMTAEVRPALVVLMIAVGLLLATATANIASVQLARAMARRREIALRAALGASARRLTRQVLVENALIGIAGGLLGLALAAAIHRSLPAVLPADFPRAGDVSLDIGVALFALAVSAVAALGVGLLPALQARRVDLVAGLANDVGSGAARGHGRSSPVRARKAIMAVQVAIACVLLVGAALLMRSFQAMLRLDRGFDPANVLTARVPLPDAAFSPARKAEVVTGVLARLDGHPDVRAAGVTTVLPLGTSDQMLGFTMPAPGSGERTPVQASLRYVSAGYFEAMGMRLAEGRAFADTDTAGSRPVAIVNRTFAGRYLQGRAIGARLPAGFDPKTAEWEVVGVVEDVRSRGLADPPQPEIFVSYRQASDGLRSDPILAVRTRRGAAGFAGPLRDLVREQAASVALDAVMTLDARLVGTLARPRLYALVLAGFAGFALAIAAVGLFGVLSYSVAQRSREMAIRAALGARPSDLVRLVLREGLVITAAGAAAGLWIASLLARSLTAFLFGIRPHDPLTFVGVPVLLIAIAALACSVPARRAVKESIIAHP